MTIINYGIPEYKLRLFTTEYNKTDAVGTGLSSTANTDDIGWIEFSSSNMYINKYVIEDDIRQKSRMNYSVDSDYQWLTSVDIIAKFDAHVYYPKSADGKSLHTDGSKLIVMVNNASDTTGTVTITGTTVEGGTSDSEVFTISGEGSYIGTKTFTSIDASGIDESGLSATISIWGLCDGLPERRREIQFWVDGNDDGYFGLIFAGYILDIRHNPVYGKDTVNIVCHDYTEFQMANEFHAGYRCPYICSNYIYSGQGVTCSELTNTSGWFSTYCRTGDMHPIHPDGTVVTEDDVKYSCSYYSASTEKLPFDGYSYNSDYAPSTDTTYAYYPEDYTRALNSICKLCNHVETDVRSCNWQPATKCSFELNGTHSDSTTSIAFENYVGWGAEEGDHIYIGTEFMKVTNSALSGTTYYNGASGTLTVTRAALKSEASGYADGVTGVLWYISTATMGVTSEDPLIIETDVSSTIYGTGKRYAETMTQLLETREAVYWVDYYRQVHILELYAEDPSYSGNFSLEEDDVLAVSGLGFSDVTNYVTGSVDTTSDGTVQARMSADDVTGVTNSINRFGISAANIDTQQINCLGDHDYSNGLRGWKPIAENYLKTHAYPIAQQTVTLRNFYPSEMYWNNGGDNHTNLNYTDPYHEYIDIKGHRIICDDYNFPDRPSKTWVVESIRYSSDEYGDSVVNMKLTRLTVESDFT